MTESQFQAKLRRALQARMPHAVIWKIADRFSCGRPDLEVILDGKATWFELKVGKNRATMIQWETLKRLRRGFVVQQLSAGYQVTHAATAVFRFYAKFEELVGKLVQLCNE